PRLRQGRHSAGRCLWRYALRQLLLGSLARCVLLRRIADRIVTLPISSTLAAAYQAHGFGARIEGGRRFVVAGTGVTPFVAVQVQTIRTDSYSEQAAIGRAGIALNYAAQTTSRLRTEIGVAVDRRVGEVWGGSFNLFARIAWAHEYWRDNS